LVPGLFESYLPLSWAQVPTILFGLGAVLVALNPEGAVTMHARQLQAAASALLRRRQGDPAQPAGPAAGDAATVQATVKGTR